MTCWNVRRRGNEYVDGRLRGRERSRYEAHLRNCEQCEIRISDIHSVRSCLSNLPTPSAPESLRSKLLVTASQERQILIETNGSRWLRLWNGWKFRLNSLMRPLTIPATGGILSSVLLFAALGITVSTSARQVAYDVPVIYADRLDANLVPLQLRSAVELTLSVDGKGHVTDYAVRNETGDLVGNNGRLQFNDMPLPEFPSVLAMAQPTIADIRISFKPIIFRQ